MLITSLRYFKAKTNVKNFFLYSTLITLRYVSRSKKNLNLLSRFLTSWLKSATLDLSHLCTGNSPLPISTYIGILLALRSAKSILQLYWFTELCSSAQVANFKPSSAKLDLPWLLMATQTILLQPHLPRRSDNSTNHLNMDQKMPGSSPPSMAEKCFQQICKSKFL